MNWLKKQFCTMSNGEKILGFFQWASIVVIVSLGAINIYQGFIDHPAYFIAGIWQIFYAALYWLVVQYQEMFYRLKKLVANERSQKD